MNERLWAVGVELIRAIAHPNTTATTAERMKKVFRVMIHLKLSTAIHLCALVVTELSLRRLSEPRAGQLDRTWHWNVVVVLLS